MTILEMLQAAMQDTSQTPWKTEPHPFRPETELVLINDEGDGVAEGDTAVIRFAWLARTHLPALLAVCKAAKEMREATESYVAEAELEPPHCDLAREQTARIREAYATQALDSALATLTQETSKP